ncbi:DUF2523 family protein [Vibrio metschnikovii]|uniref:DUF2523 family protein n=1 Tax=Vibrio metschnikovii TaxID=28172 RepID=UPI002FC7FA46
MFQWIKDIYQKLLDLLYMIYISLRDILFDIPLYVFDQIFKVAGRAMQAVLQMFKPFDLSNYLTFIPSEVSWVLSMVGLPQCLAIIASAIALRLILQVIPFTRLGS